jgi:tRNA (cytidine/uridine-2'-O-)-methyltransferase
MFNIVLYQPEIPPNTGNIIRLCANTGARLHLIQPLGFDLDDKKLKRAGLDYSEWAFVNTYPDLESYLKKTPPDRVFAISTRGRTRYCDCRFEPDDSFIFGPETRGLPTSFLNSLPAEQTLRIPMFKHSRSLNLSNAVSIIIYEALRQNNFRNFR